MTTQGTVLVVDDNDFAREATEGMLYPLGYTVYTASNGPEGLEMLDQVQPDVMLLDVMMPGMDGFEVCRRVRNLFGWRDLPILLLTSLDDRESRIRGLEAGADDFLTKPMDKAELRARVRTTVQLGRTRRQLQERARFEWVVMHSNDGFLWLDDAGICQGMNPIAARWLDLDRKQTTGRSWLDLMAKKFDVHPPLEWSSIQEDPKAFRVTLIRPEAVQSHGLWLQAVGEPSTSMGQENSGWMIHLQDVTSQQIHMQQVIALVEMIAHKLRTPLSLMKLPLESLIEGYIDTYDTEWPEFSRILRTGYTRLERSTEQVLNLANWLDSPLFNAGSDPLTAVDVAALAEQVCNSFDLPTERWYFEQRTEQGLSINPGVLEVILHQLVDNAVKFHPQQTPSLSIVLEDAEAGCVHLCVEDDGPGIPPEFREEIWKPLYQIDPYRTGQIPGMGTGLTLVANYVMGMGGRCFVEAAHPQGTRVSLILPRRERVQ